MAEITLPTNRGDIIRLEKEVDGFVQFGVMVADYSSEVEARSGEGEIVYFIAGNGDYERAEDVLEMLGNEPEVKLTVIPYGKPE